MKSLFIVANFKSHKNRFELEEWVNVFKKLLQNQNIAENKTIILAPPFPSIMIFTNQLLNFEKIQLAVQDISPFPAGAYTGAVSAENLYGFGINYAIVGHSERRINFHEDEAILISKIKESKKNHIKTIFCVQGKETFIPEDVDIVAYEPVFAIGTGVADNPENANNVAQEIKQKNIHTVLYGGSISPENVHTFTEKNHIDGVLVGNASLDPIKFFQIIQNA